MKKNRLKNIKMLFNMGNYKKLNTNANDIMARKVELYMQAYRISGNISYLQRGNYFLEKLKNEINKDNFFN